MPYRVSKNRLVALDGTPAVDWKPTQNRGAADLQPLYLIMHYTAGLSLSGTINWFENPEAQASAHFVIGRDGTVVQMVELNRRAWHAGVSKWGELVGMNAYSIGIELDNAGKLQRRADGTYVFVSRGGQRAIPNEQVVLARHQDEQNEAGWHEYTPEQLDAAVWVGQALHAAFNFTDVLGHDDVSPGRKIDPGPAFPMLGFRSQVLGRA